MKKKEVSVLFMIFIFFVSFTIFPMHAETAGRQGFIIGVDFGAGVALLAEAGAPDIHCAPFGIDAGWVIGFAPTDRFLLFMVHDLTIFDYTLVGDLYDGYFDFIWGLPMPLSIGALIVTSPYPLLFIPHMGSQTLLGLGGRYYCEEEAPSFFAEADTGAFIVYDPFIREIRGGLGASLGAGYEFYPHFDVKCMIKWSVSLESHAHAAGAAGVLNAFSLNISLGATAY